MWPMILMRMVGRKVVRVMLSNLLCMTIFNVMLEVLSSFIFPYLHPHQALPYTPQLRPPHEVLGEVERSGVLEHVGHQRHEMLYDSDKKANAKVLLLGC